MLDKLQNYYQTRYLLLAGGLLILLSLGMLSYLMMGLSLSGSRPPSLPLLGFLFAALAPGVIGVGFILKKLWAWWLFLIAIPIYIIWFIWVVQLPSLITNWDEYQRIYRDQPIEHLETFQNEYISISHPVGWQFNAWDEESLLFNEEYKFALHPIDAAPIQYYKLPFNIDEGGDLADGNAEGLHISIEDNIAYLAMALPPEEYAKAVMLSGKPSLEIVGMPVAKNIYRETVAGREYVSQYASLPLYRNAEARWLLVIYRVPADEYNEETADAVMQSLELNQEFWKALTVEEAQDSYNQNADELREYNDGKFITGEDLLKDESTEFSSWLGLRDVN